MDTNGHTILFEDYVSFETAKLLKEKGFDEPCVGFYNPIDGCFFEACIRKAWEYDKHGSINAPTHQMALKWLREVHDLHIIVYPWQADNEEKAIHWCCTVYKSFAHLGNDVYINETPKSYEEAVEAAILYVLKNLI